MKEDIKNIQNNLYDASDDLTILIIEKINIARELIKYLSVIKKSMTSFKDIAKSSEILVNIFSKMKITKNKKIIIQELETLQNQIIRYTQNENILSEYYSILSRLDDMRIPHKNNIYNILDSHIIELLIDKYDNPNKQNLEDLSANIIIDVFNMKKKWRGNLVYTSIEIELDNKKIAFNHIFKDENKKFIYKI